jgi:hypothetical protein
MRGLTSVTPATPRQVWCDGANARICWARHTSHTSHPFLRDRKSTYTPPCHRGRPHMRRVEGIDRICRGSGDWCDAPSKSGRFRCHPSRVVACHTCAAATD